ncbi:MAG TPA: MaoC/PaaZ C-terminal domain-containing protein [Acidimicrobiia bacterium]|nr:MaoC/PaaZ C-terminal domain-containing protein [Acidimicrobiia bacterium]
MSGSVAVGQEKQQEFPPLTRTMFVRYAGASGDFNPMHHDDTIAAQVGNPSVFGHGMLTAGILARVVKDWFGPTAMRKFSVRFSKQVWPGDVLTSTATITALNPDGDGGTVDLDLLVKNQDDVSVLSGTATVALDK